jgi:hypothetical protein
MSTALVRQRCHEEHGDDAVAPAICQRFVAKAETTEGPEHPGGE